LSGRESYLGSRYSLIAVTDNNTAPSNASDLLNSLGNGASHTIPASVGKQAIATDLKQDQQDSDDVVAKLDKLLSERSGDRHLVLIQDFPDPDALSSAWAYRLICKQYNIE